uniref:KAT8 regulatory NSL complex subunit 2 n=1 Tax=Amphimedon queenslandica TaxID=400682 RepID=A0A1X7VA41_AMPQE
MASSSKAEVEEAREIDEPHVEVTWKGENESDSEYVLSIDNFPLDSAGVWTEQEALSIYKGKMERLRMLYMGQLSRLGYLLQERRRRFLQEWQAVGGAREKASLPSEGGNKYDIAYRCYRKRTLEQGLLERKQKLKRVSATLDLYTKKELKDTNRSHYQHLVKLQQQLKANNSTPCTTTGCNQLSLPFAAKCSKHIVEDSKQQLYTSCSYTGPNGTTCNNPVPKYLEPLLCGGHWDQGEVVIPSDTESDSDHDDDDNDERKDDDDDDVKVKNEN